MGSFGLRAVVRKRHVRCEILKLYILGPTEGVRCTGNTKCNVYHELKIGMALGPR